MTKTNKHPTDTHHKGTRTQVVGAGAVAGLVSRFCIATLYVLKIRLQLQYHSLSEPLASPSNRRPAGVWDVAKGIWKHGGITGFWKGNIPAEGLYLSYGAVQFLAYRSANQAIDALAHEANVKIPGTLRSFVAGALAGTAGRTC